MTPICKRLFRRIVFIRDFENTRRIGPLRDRVGWHGVVEVGEVLGFLAGGGLLLHVGGEARSVDIFVHVFEFVCFVICLLRAKLLLHLLIPHAIPILLPHRLLPDKRHALILRSHCAVIFRPLVGSGVIFRAYGGSEFDTVFFFDDAHPQPIALLDPLPLHHKSNRLLHATPNNLLRALVVAELQPRRRLIV